MDILKLETWLGLAAAASSAVVAFIAARDARASARKAERINQDLLKAQLRDEARQKEAAYVQAEAERIAIEAKNGWHSHMISTSVNVGRYEHDRDTRHRHTMNVLLNGIAVPTGTLGRADVAARLVTLPGVQSARAEPDGYRVMLHFDDTTFQLAP